jgi:hypothetical protein
VPAEAGLTGRAEALIYLKWRFDGAWWVND